KSRFSWLYMNTSTWVSRSPTPACSALLLRGPKNSSKSRKRSNQSRRPKQLANTNLLEERAALTGLRARSGGLRANNHVLWNPSAWVTDRESPLGCPAGGTWMSKTDQQSQAAPRTKTDSSCCEVPVYR